MALKPLTEGVGARRLLDFGTERLDAVNEAGIDVAVLSLTTSRSPRGEAMLSAVRTRP